VQNRGINKLARGETRRRLRVWRRRRRQASIDSVKKNIRRRETASMPLFCRRRAAYLPRIARLALRRKE